ncbi:hypothetical protein SPBR_02027 [Sporothrix brasiliensis 5110]|uniref:Tetraspanin n=1 Tax=Sporothrix brasiliensis 5110 TaxID=1398154 RepID=A0A0C2J2G9_9PEZI|nr:uncharacterized protein SPBR_02027 [Sporothrix brasiliensis 5110]KIH91277.1 hypothetical protein SPBR_02027 [Sporothrix brasiliensis 5110]
MANKILVTYVVADVLFVIMGAIMLAFSIIVKNKLSANAQPADGTDVVINLLYAKFPLTAGIANAVLYFVTFLFTIPAMAMPTRGWLKISGYMVLVTSLFSLIIGLDLWILTLSLKEQFGTLWIAQNSQTQDLMQTAFACCGYLNSTSPAFVTDSTCTSPAAAALVRGCAGPISSFSNVFVDDIFTGVFGMSGVGGLLILATSCLLKDRKERERFRYIDEKMGATRRF